MRKLLTAATVAFFVVSAAQAETTCFGEYPYRVCSSVRTYSDGSMKVESWDSEGNTYSVESEVIQRRDGSSTIRSWDSEGNDYQVDSWSDSTGVHSRDSEGNSCTITRRGTVIGC